MQKRALGFLFSVIAISLGLLAGWAALAGGRAWVIALCSAALALWMADSARRIFLR